MAKKVFKRWTDEEISDLKEMYNEPYEILENHFSDRSLKSIKHKIKNMGLPRDMQWSVWSDEEINILLNNYKLPQEELQKLLPNRTWTAIIKTCFNMKLDDRPKGWYLWKKEEIEILYNSDNIEEVYKLIPNRSPNIIRQKCSELEIYFNKWEEWEDNYLKNNYLDSSWDEMLSFLKKRNKRAIYMRAHRLNLERKMGRTDVTDDDIIKLYEEGSWRAKISKDLKLSNTTVNNRLLRNNIKAENKILKGEEHHLWKGNSSELERLRRTAKYSKWRLEVFERDLYCCQKCLDSRGGNLEAHHIFNFSSYEEGRFEVSNGITLCRTCHTSGSNSFHSIYGTKNNTRQQLEEFLSLT